MKHPRVFENMFVVLCSALVLALPCPGIVQAQSLRDKLIGSWELVSWTWQSTAADVAEPGTFGPDAIGRLVYAADGNMCVQLMRANRPDVPGYDWRGGTMEEKANAFDSYLAYCGNFELADSGGYVLHKIVTSSYPNWTGSTQKRFIVLDEGRLTLMTPTFTMRGMETAGVLVWQRSP